MIVATPNPCDGPSIIKAKTTCSRSDNCFSLTETMRLVRNATKRLRVASLSVILAGASTAVAASTDTVGATARTTDSFSGDITVSAAASLTEPFVALGRQFRKRHPQVRVRFNFASTSSLVAQIQNGAPVDVFASADMASQDRLALSGNIVNSPQVFARNTMRIAVKPGNPLSVRGLSDLPGAGIVALCNATVPCGIYASTVLGLAKVTLPAATITRGVDAKATLAAVSIGDADAAIVYTTDVLSAGRRVQGVVIPPAQNVRAMYGISLVRGTTERAAAQAFMRHVLSPEGRKTLSAFGFLAP
jgi:molybdate transport system substrate-binding protein